MGRVKSQPPPVHDYDIRMRADGTVVLFTRYRGHNFEGWHTRETMEKLESMGVLSWDADGNPVVKEPAETR